MQHINEFQLSEIKQLLATPKKIAIIPHRNVDGDAMGSTLGLYHILKQLNHQITVVVPNEIPDYLQWIPGTNDATLIFEGAHTNKATSILKEAELIFTLDFNAFHRTGEQMETVLKTLSSTFIMIDHHDCTHVKNTHHHTAEASQRKSPKSKPFGHFGTRLVVLDAIGHGRRRGLGTGGQPAFLPRPLGPSDHQYRRIRPRMRHARLGH